MAKLIPEWAVKTGAGCRCKDFAAKMDKWGIEGCQRRRGVIVAHLLGQAEHLIPLLKRMPTFAMKVAVSHTLRSAIAKVKARTDAA